MPVLETKLNPRSDDFRAASDVMRTLVADLKSKVAQRLRRGWLGG